MSTVERVNILDLADERDCRDLLFEMYECVDGGRAADAIHLFDPHAVFATPTGVNRGTKEILSALTERQAKRSRRTRHVTANLRFTKESADEVKMTGTLVLFILSSENPLVPSRLAELNDTFIRREGRWLIGSHGSTKLVAHD